MVNIPVYDHNQDLSVCMLDWCSPSSRFLNNTSNFVIEDHSVIDLFIIFCAMSIMGLLIYIYLNEKVIQWSTNGSNLHFVPILFALIMFAILSLVNQSLSSLICRPVEILYNSQFSSMLGIQLYGFLISLLGAYSLGSVFIPLFDRTENNIIDHRNRLVSSRSVKRLTSHKLRT